MIATQTLQALVRPVILVFMVLLVNDERIMGRHRNGRIADVLTWSTVVLIVALEAVGVTVP